MSEHGEDGWPLVREDLIELVAISTRLQELAPPERFAEAHEQLIALFEEMAAGASDMVEGIDQEDLEATHQGLDRMNAASRGFRAVLAALNAAQAGPQ
jgi:hypothetical protein